MTHSLAHSWNYPRRRSLGVVVVATVPVSLLLFLLLLFDTPPEALGLLASEAGLVDFVVSTAGHGGPVRGATFLARDDDADAVVLTSGGACSVAARTVKDGTLQWRRDGCVRSEWSSSSSSSSSSRDALVVVVGGTTVVTLDRDELVLRGWQGTSGNLLFDASVQREENSNDVDHVKLYAVGTDRVAVVTGDVLSVHSTTTTNGGATLRTLSATEELRRAGVKPCHLESKAGTPTRGRVLAVSAREEVLLGWTFRTADSTAARLSGLAVWSKNDEVAKEVSYPADKTMAVEASSMSLYEHSQAGLSLVAKKLVVGDHHNQNSVLVNVPGLLVAARDAKKSWFPISSAAARFRILHDSCLVVSTPRSNDDTLETQVFFLHGGGEPASDDWSNVAVVAVTATLDRTVVLTKDHQLVFMDPTLTQTLQRVALPASQMPPDPVVDVYCDDASATVLLTTNRGTSLLWKVNDTATLLWSQEETLSDVSQAMFVDASASYGDEGGVATTTATTVPDVVTRLRLQWESLTNTLVQLPLLLTPSNTTNDFSRDVKFGFGQWALLLNEPYGRLIAMDTLRHKGAVQWTLSLPLRATRHVVVRGGTSRRVATDGRMDTPAHDDMIMVLSVTETEETETQVEYRCVHGVEGTISTQGVVAMTAPVAQIMPLRATDDTDTDTCPQLALLLLTDGSVQVLPPQTNARSLLQHQSRQGVYTHAIDQGRFRSYRLHADDDEDDQVVRAEPVGETVFGEKILRVAYPPRGEVVTSPAAILGDDALLLKYANPHLVVVVTYEEEEGKNQDEDDEDLVFSRLLSHQDKLKKPLGVTPSKTADSTTTTVTKDAGTNLFINVVDSVTSNILHRISHTHASPHHPIPVLITENWIVYTYYNTLSKRTDLGVLTLHEGMIGKHDITAFHTQIEQQLDFSSFTSSKPVVLHKLYTLLQPKLVTAIGTTRTARGLTSPHIVLAHAGSSQLVGLDRRWLDPRRPAADPKAAEKTEGLQKWQAVLPWIPQRLVPSYHLTVEGVRGICSAGVQVESHSLLLAYGGNDVFFTRQAPSKGFDMLPDEFSKGVLSVVVLGLCGVFVVLQRMNNKSAVVMAWK